jgi:hypothetical protein
LEFQFPFQPQTEIINEPNKYHHKVKKINKIKTNAQKHHLCSKKAVSTETEK